MSVARALADAGTIESAGGSVYVAGLPNLIPVSDVLPEYVSRLVACARSRRVLRLSLSLQHSAYNGGGVPADAVTEMRSLLESLDASNGEALSGPRSPEVHRDGDEFTYLWNAFGIGVGVSQLREAGDGLHAELTVRSSVESEPLHWGRLNLASTSAREGLVKKLDTMSPKVDWRRMLERVCRDMAETFRAGEPITVLEPAAATTSRHLVERLMPSAETTVLFGDGGSGKSLVALALAIAVSAQTALPCGLRPTQRAQTLYLDWESSKEVHAERLAHLLAGLGLLEAHGIYYRPMVRALADDAARLRVEISRRGIGLVVVDSFGPACGAEPEGADAAIRLMNALRSFAPATRLLVAHVSKTTAEQRTGPSRPFGSVYVTNLGRSVWELRRSDEDGEELMLGLFHRKVNQGRRFPPMGLRIEFGKDLIRLRQHDVAEVPDLLARMSLSSKIQKLLSTGARTTGEIAQEADAKEDSVGRTLRRLKDQGKVISLDDARGGRGHGAKWGLKST